MKIYTKKGDTGTTSLYDGTKVTKSNIIIQSVGDLDELNTEIGTILSHYNINNNDIDENNKKYYELLSNIQNEIFDMGAIIANDPNQEKFLKLKLFDIENKFIENIESYIDEMTAILPKLSNFILPGGNLFISSIHKARTVCRRAERNITLFKHDILNLYSDTDQNSIENIHRCLAYINRLSDYLFTLARFTAYILNVNEIIYKRSRIITE